MSTVGGEGVQWGGGVREYSGGWGEYRCTVGSGRWGE